MIELGIDEKAILSILHEYVSVCECQVPQLNKIYIFYFCLDEL